ncbi:MAG: fibronectin type III domain-containing protein [Bacteroidales bacterium]|nr:fibronectin type III domain-containing protein [Bacteroidales bacterium]
MKKTALILLTLLVFNLQNIFGQGYPVQTTMHISAPYSPLIEDYYAGVNPSMRLTALYKDFNSTTALPVRLQFTIESDKGFKITTNPNFVPTPINLNGGENYQISDAELSQYFTPQALTVVGNGADKFLRERRLPDGFYRFYVKINDYHRNITISNQAIAIAWIRLNEPPRWITPTNNATIPGTYPQNVMFTWMIQHVASPAGKSDVEYHFELFEAATNDISPEVIIRSQRPLYTDIINATSLIYSADKPILTPGKKYVCRIKAVDNQNYITFKNEGYTTPLVFIFGKECKPPYNIQTPEPTKTSVTLEWQSDYDNEPTQLQLRETGDNTSEWYTYKTNQTSIIIDKLSAGHPYEVQLRNVCDGAFSPWTAPKRFKTTPLGLTQNKKNCSAEEVHFPITNNEPLAELMVGEVITVDGFRAVITSVEGSNGNFSGSCDLFVPFVGAKIQCTFKNITVTQSMQVSNGSVIAVRGPKVTFVGGGNSGGTGDDNGNGTGNGAGGAGNYQISGDTLQLTNGQGVDTVYVDNSGQVIIIDTKGDTIKTGQKDIVIIDNTGGTGTGGSDTVDVYYSEDAHFVKESKPISTNSDNTNAENSNSNFKVVIEPTRDSDDSRFDDNTKGICSKYPTYSTNNNIQAGAPWFYTKVGISNNVKIRTYPYGLLDGVFIQSESNKISLLSKGNKTTKTIDFNAKVKGDNLEIRLKKDSIKGKTIGGLNIISCKEKNYKVQIVLLHDSSKALPPAIDFSEIKNYFNKIYASINVNTVFLFDTMKISYSNIYDLNNDGKLDKVSEAIPLLNKNIFGGIDYTVYITDLELFKPGSKLKGIARANKEYPQMNIKPNALVTTFGNYNVESSLSHELGHLIFGLLDVYLDTTNVSGFLRGDDIVNIMDYVQDGDAFMIDKRKLRAYQVIEIESKN